MIQKVWSWIQTYWPIAVLVIVLGAMMFYWSHQNDHVRAMEEDIATTRDLLDSAEQTQESVETFDEESHQEIIQERTVSAEAIAEEMIAVDDTLTAFYKTNEPLPEGEEEREALFQERDQAQAKNTALTGATEADHIKTWQLNPEWALELESVVTYQDTDQVPVVFSMTTKDGAAAGLIYAIYHVQEHTLDNISRHYTTDGLRDEAAIGGI